MTKYNQPLLIVPGRAYASAALVVSLSLVIAAIPLFDAWQNKSFDSGVWFSVALLSVVFLGVGLSLRIRDFFF